MKNNHGRQRDAERGGLIVVGAGIVGVCVAVALQRDGWQVTLIDRQEPGTECSFGNAGLLHAGGCIPMATPGAVRHFPSMLLDAESPLQIPWRYLPVLAPWLFRLAAQARSARVKHNIEALYALLKPARQHYEELLSEANLLHLVKPGGELYLYRTAQSMQAADWEMTVRREKGIVVKNLDASGIRDLEPDIAAAFQYGHFLPESDYVISPYQLTKGLVAHFVQHGGTVVQGEVDQIQATTEGVVVQVDGRSRQATRLVLCAGAWSARLTRQLGVSIPLESGRGYHIMLPKQALSIKRVVVDADHHVAVAPMVDGLRVIGFVEFAGLDAPVNQHRSQTLKNLAGGLFPSLNDEVKSSWMGHRPSTPDSLPVLGPLPGYSAIFCAFGHGQLGLTLAAVTGKIMADMLAGRRASIDCQPYRANRFAARRG